MKNLLREIVAGLLGQRPPHLQVGALCLRQHQGQTQVLVISSRGTGRWIIPKGWPMRGRSLAAAALQEAWEEAGVIGKVGKTALGSYTYLKLEDEGFALRCEVRVFPVAVASLSEDYPEASKRDRRWLSLGEAAERVQEKALRHLLLDQIHDSAVVSKPQKGYPAARL